MCQRSKESDQYQSDASEMQARDCEKMDQTASSERIFQIEIEMGTISKNHCVNQSTRCLIEKQPIDTASDPLLETPAPIFYGVVGTVVNDDATHRLDRSSDPMMPQKSWFIEIVGISRVSRLGDLSSENNEISWMPCDAAGFPADSEPGIGGYQNVCKRVGLKNETGCIERFVDSVGSLGHQ